MIQVCSRCGTQWNVREQRRYWCPRCRGTLLEPGATLPMRPPAAARPPVAPPARGPVAPPPGGRVATPPGRPAGASPRLPAGYRWIAVRPGSPPPPPRRHRPLGPTPRYLQIPRWGLFDRIEPVSDGTSAVAGVRLAARILQPLLSAAVVTLAIVSGLQLFRYLLMVLNRSVLLPGFVAFADKWLTYVSAVAAAIVVVAAMVCFLDWLRIRRADAYREAGLQDPRGGAEFWVLCLVAPYIYPQVFTIELAQVEGRRWRLARTIRVWWVLWAVTWLLAGIAWSYRPFVETTQGIADDALYTSVAYAVAAVTAWWWRRVVLGFTDPEGGRQRAVRWIPAEAPQSPAAPQADAPGSEQNSQEDISDIPATSVEPVGAEPAALDRERVAGAW